MLMTRPPVENMILSQAELHAITGYRTALHQLAILHARGFARAYRSRQGHVILERAHYLAVCQGNFSRTATTHKPSVNTSFLKQA